jgi:uncharacterized membrane protein
MTSILLPIMISPGKQRRQSQVTRPKEQQGEPPPRTIGEVGPLGQVLPPPETLALYNEAEPNAAARILSLAERGTAHREDIERTIVEAGIKDQRLRVFFVFATAVLAIGGGIFLIAIGKDGYGIAAIISSLVPLASLFMKK